MEPATGIASAEMTSSLADKLYPLSLFCEEKGMPLPEYTIVEGEAVPMPYNKLLVHNGDMTSRLEKFHSSPMRLRVLNEEVDNNAKRREVVLVAAESGEAAEYGAIDINLAAFSEPVRRLILEGRRPLGGILNEFGVKYHSEPRAFVHLHPNAAIMEALELDEATPLFGRCNLLLGEDGKVLARIVELLPPAKLE